MVVGGAVSYKTSKFSLVELGISDKGQTRQAAEKGAFDKEIPSNMGCAVSARLLIGHTWGGMVDSLLVILGRQ